jgi:dienelactone hydrolase
MPVIVLLALAALSLAPTASRAEPDSRPAVDAPELARLGPHGVGVRTFTLVEPRVPNLAAFDRARGAAPLADRTLQVEVWYPAVVRPGDRPVVYHDALPSEAHGQEAAFTIEGLAVRDAAVDRGGPYPLVVLSHGYSGTPVALSWLAENLASKGYVVVGPHHRDPPITDSAQFAIPLLLRPLDIAFTAHAVQRLAKGGDPFFGGLVDPSRVALAGYSMGGYGVLTVAGATIEPSVAAQTPGGALAPYARGGRLAGDLRIDGLKAVVAISPFGGAGPPRVWGPAGLADLRAPSLFIVGEQDRLVGYSPGVRTLFEQAVNAPRYLLVLREAGHSIGMDSAPESMRGKLWDLDWFEDPVWRKSRIIGVNLHMITAFLDLYVKDDAGRAPYLQLVPNSDDGVWPFGAPPTAYGAYSPGSGSITVWKGFQNVHSAGLLFERRDPQPGP